MPHGFKSPAGEADLWIPMDFQPNDIDRGQTYLQVIGRLKRDFTLDQAQAEMDGVAKGLAAQYPNSNQGRGIRLVSLSEHVVGSVRRALLIVLGAVGLVLLIACANVANLFLVKAARRQHEIAIRAALGASTARLVQQLLCEAFIVALGGGVLGLLAAAGALELIKSLAPDQLPRLDEIGIDRATLIFTIGASRLTGVLAGLAPALYVCRPNLNDALKDNRTQMAPGGWRRNRLQSAFVVAQVAVALALLSGAGLLIRSFVQLVRVNPGFQTDGLLVARIALGDDYREGNRQVTYFQELTNRLKSLPAVKDAAAATVLPMNPFGIDFDVPYHRADQAEPAGAAAPKAKFRAATPDYFRTMGIPLIHGRGFIEQDRSDAPKVVVVNQLLAERAWPGENPVGKQLRFVWADWQKYEVVGLVGNTKSYGLVENWQPELFVPQAQIPYTTPDYFRTMGIPLIHGRGFIEQDRSDAPKVVVVNQLLAERAWPGENPVGKQLRFVWADWQKYEVVGLVGNTKSYGLVENWQPELFVPQAQIPYTMMNVVIRTTGDPADIAAAARHTILDQDPHQPPHSIVAMDDLISDSIAQGRFAMTWLVVLATVALALASVGIYSVISHLTALRTREIGIRMALGAQSSDVMTLVMRNGMILALTGVAIGLAGSLILTQLIESLLFGVSASDVTTLTSVSALMIVVSLLATYIPARRATRVDPLVAFKYE